MPEAWAKLLDSSGISQAEKAKNPDAVVKALEFMTKRSSHSENDPKFLTAQRYGKEEERGRGRDEVSTRIMCSG